MDSLGRLLAQASRANDPLAEAAVTECSLLVAALMHLMHVLNHIDPEVVVAAAAAAHSCDATQGGSTHPVH